MTKTINYQQLEIKNKTNKFKAINEMLAIKTFWFKSQHNLN